MSERLLTIDLRAREDVALVIVPSSVDGAIFCSRESDFPPQLIVAYEPE